MLKRAVSSQLTHSLHLAHGVSHTAAPLNTNTLHLNSPSAHAPELCPGLTATPTHTHTHTPPHTHTHTLQRSGPGMMIGPGSHDAFPAWLPEYHNPETERQRERESVCECVCVCVCVSVCVCMQGE